MTICNGFDALPERDGRTDGRTHGQNSHNNEYRVSVQMPKTLRFDQHRRSAHGASATWALNVPVMTNHVVSIDSDNIINCIEFETEWVARCCFLRAPVNETLTRTLTAAVLSV